MKRPISESQFLVTGAAGFVGAHVAGQLLDAGAKIVGIDNLNDYYDPTLKQHRVEVLQKNQAFEFHEMDVENLGDLGKLFDNNAFDGVINLAARAGVRASVKDPHIYLQTSPRHVKHFGADASSQCAQTRPRINIIVVRWPEHAIRRNDIGQQADFALRGFQESGRGDGVHVPQLV